MHAIPNIVYITLCKSILHINNCWIQLTSTSMIINNTSYHYTVKTILTDTHQLLYSFVHMMIYNSGSTENEEVE